MNPLSYKLVDKINEEVNTSITYRSDAAVYNKPEFWTPAVKLGDCEDYALLKRNKLLAAGADESQMGLVCCYVRELPDTVSGHCVLWVNTDKGGFILDNRYQGLQRPTDLDYIWESM